MGKQLLFKSGFHNIIYLHRIAAILLIIITQMTQSTPAHAAPSAIDLTEDVKSMGYTDNRKIVRDSVNNLYVVYRKKYRVAEHTNYHIFMAKSADNGRTWVTLNDGAPIETVGPYTQRVPAVAIDSQDNLHVVWYGLDADHPIGENRQIKYSRSTDGGRTWTHWQNIAEVSGYAEQELWQEHPAIYIDPADRVYVVWEGRDVDYPDAGQIKFTSSVDGGVSWTPWVNIAPAAKNRSRPSLLAVNGKQLYVVAYGKLKGQQQVLYVASRDSGETWSAWRPIAPARKDQRHVAIALDDQDQLHAVWRQEPQGTRRGARPQIHYAHFNGVHWSKATIIAPQNHGGQFFPSVTSDAQGLIWVAWTESSRPAGYPQDAPTDGKIYYAVKQGSAWSAGTLLRQSAVDIYGSLRRNRDATDRQIDLVWLENGQSRKTVLHQELTLPTTWPVARTAVTTKLLGVASISIWDALIQPDFQIIEMILDFARLIPLLTVAAFLAALFVVHIERYAHIICTCFLGCVS